MFQKLANFFSGRHTLFLCFFAGMGTVMAWFHRLDPSYVSLCIGLQSMVLAHSYKEDKFQGPVMGGGNDGRI